jgi:hypothetical protein
MSLEEIDTQIEREEGLPIQSIRGEAMVSAPPGYPVHSTPMSGSRLNQMQRVFAEITEKQIRGGVSHCVAASEKAIQEYLATSHEEPGKSCGPPGKYESWTVPGGFVGELPARRLFPGNCPR